MRVVCKCGWDASIPKRAKAGKEWQNHADTSFDGLDHSDYDIVE